MPGTIQFMELFSPGGKALGCQKLAFKLPAKGDPGKGDGPGFAEIMAALAHMPAEQLQQSLAKLDWVAAAGDSKERIPLIDLTQLDQKGGNSLAWLLGANPDQKTNSVLDQWRMRQMGSPALLDQAADAGSDTAAKTNQGALWAASLIEQEAQASESSKENLQPGAPKALDAEAALASQMLQSDGTSTLKEGRNSKKQIADWTRPAFERTPADIQGSPENEAVKSMQGLLHKTDTKTENSMTSQKQNPAAEVADAQTGTKQMPAALAGSFGPKGNDELKGIREKLGDGLQPRTEGNVPSTAASQIPTNESALLQPHARGAENIENARAADHSEAALSSKETQNDVIRQIVQRMTLRSDGKQSQMDIRLKPEVLGNLRMEVITQNQHVMVRMTAENQSVKEIIEQNIHLLKNELQQHGLQIQKFDVFVSQNNDAWRQNHQQEAFRQAQQQRNRQSRQKSGQMAAVEDAGLIASAGQPAQFHNRGEVDFFA